jgi:membrane fusion protein (multidrug efflux system)
MDVSTVDIEQEHENETAERAEAVPLPSRWRDPRLRKQGVGALAVALAVVVAVWVYESGSVSTDDAQVDGHIVPVASKVYGDVAAVNVEDNQAVKAGQVLVEIDPRDYQAKVDQARAALALAESQARAAEVGVPLTDATTASSATSAAAQVAMAQADNERANLAFEQASGSELEAARAVVSAREAANEKAQSDLARMRPLAEKAEISRQYFDGVKAAAKVADSELRAAREKLAATELEAAQRKAAALAARSRLDQAGAAYKAALAGRKQVDVSSAQAASAKALVEQARANLAAAELQLSYTKIVAPMDGVITKKSVERGQILQPGQSLFVIVPLQDVWVTANFKETQLARVKPGQRAEVKVDMYGQSFRGKVDSVAGTTGARMSLLPPENATGNYVKVVQRIPVKIVLDTIPPDKAILRPGMNVEASISTR